MTDLKWKKFPVLSDGFICLVDHMGTDRDIANAARVSYGNDNWDKRIDEKLKGVEPLGYPKFRNDVDDILILNRNYSAEQINNATAKLDKEDEHLIRYLMRHRHTTPFEMVELKFLVRVPMDCWRQWIRHRVFATNEYSTRYTPAINSNDTTNPNEWRLQSKNNKQGSDGFLDEWPDSLREMYTTLDTAGQYLSNEEKLLHKQARDVYEERLTFGIAKEQARKDLPLSTYTTAYWKGNLHNLFHFLSLRMDSHAQKEIRDYANIIGKEIVAELFPVAWKAFCDYRLNGMFLTGLDIETIGNLIKTPANKEDFAFSQSKEWRELKRCRERDECIAKLEQLGLVEDGNQESKEIQS